MTPREHYQRAMEIAKECQRRHEAAGGGVSPANFDLYLTPEEKCQLHESLRALPWKKSAPVNEFAPDQPLAG
jgi:hypothetical protein